MSGMINLVIGFILLVVFAGIYVTQNAETLGSSLAYTVTGFITVAIAIGLLAQAFKLAKGSEY